jgi:hypothetical protein
LEWHGQNRLNILRLHDKIEFQAHHQTDASALATRGFNPSGLFANVATLLSCGRILSCAPFQIGRCFLETYLLEYRLAAG